LTKTRKGQIKLEKILNALTNSAQPLTRDEIAKKTGYEKHELHFILFGYRTNHLFIKHPVNLRINKYSLSATGHCANASNDFMRGKYKQETKKIELIDSLAVMFFKITIPRCKPYAC